MSRRIDYTKEREVLKTINSPLNVRNSIRGLANALTTISDTVLIQVIIVLLYLIARN